MGFSMNENCTTTQEQLSIVYISLLCFSYSLVSAFICFGNILTIVAVCKTRVLRTIPNMYIVSLAMADLMVGALVIPLVLIGNLSYFAHQTYRSELMCIATLGIFFLSVSASIMFMILIAIDRTLYIGFPFHYQRLTNTFRTKVIILGGWILSIGYAVIPSVTYYEWDECTVCDELNVLNRNFQIFGQLGFYVVVCTIIPTCYGYIFKIAKHQQKQCLAENQPGVKRKLENDVKLIKLFFLVFGVFFICWTPSIFLTAMSVFGFQISHKLANLILPIGLLNSGMNFLIYSIKNEDFRTVFRRYFCRNNQVHDFPSTVIP